MPAQQTCITFWILKGVNGSSALSFFYFFLPQTCTQQNFLLQSHAGLFLTKIEFKLSC